MAASYWSNDDGKCILPRRVARLSISMTTYDECHIGPRVGGQSLFGLSLGVEPSWIDALDLPPLLNPQYFWKYNHKLATPIGPINGPSLVLSWLTSSHQETSIGLTVTTQQGVKLEASLSVVVRSEAQARLLAQLCSLRKFINSVTQTSHFLIDPLGSDIAKLPTEHDIENLKLFARKVAQHVESISVLSKAGDRPFARGEN
jgi:hypothetical protein